MSWAGSGSTGEVIDDSVITTKVKSSYVADSTVSALDISVETNQGVVALTGLVNTEVERQRAVQIARETSGVKQVDARNLIVKK
jgi:hyperosmotically inducible protein